MIIELKCFIFIEMKENRDVSDKESCTRELCQKAAQFWTLQSRKGHRIVVVGIGKLQKGVVKQSSNKCLCEHVYKTDKKE